MKKRLKLKKFVMPTVYTILVSVFLLTSVVAFKSPNKQDNKKDKIQYVSNSIISSDVPVMSTTKVFSKPYNNDSVKIGKYFYDYSGDKDSQQNSILFYDNTYIQNSGVDYILDDSFDVICVYDGVVIKVEDNDIVGKTIEIKHDNNIITVYQSLDSINYKEGDSVAQGAVIGRSGKSKVGESLGNHLHFELYINGQVVNPENYFGKEINELAS